MAPLAPPNVLNPSRRIQALVDEFVRKVTELAWKEAARVALVTRVGTDRPLPSRNAAARRKRPARDQAGLEARVLAYVALHPGVRVPEINKALGTIRQDLKRPIRVLLAAKQLRSVGRTRSTRYYVP